MVRLPKLDPVEFLIERRFPNYRVLQSAPPHGRVGHLSEDEAASQRQDIARYEDELREKSDDEIAVLYKQELAVYQAEKEQKAQLEEEQRFFNQPEVDADSAHWSKMAVWRLEEATMLLFGKDPAAVSWEQIKSLTDRSVFAKKFEKARELVIRAESAQQLTDPIMPVQFLGWARSLDLSIPESLIVLVEKYSGPVADWKDRYDELEKIRSRLDKELKQLKIGDKSSQMLGKNESWLKFEGLAIDAIDQYPSWRKRQKKVQKTVNLQDWLTTSIGASNREAELLKKVLSDAFEELR